MREDSIHIELDDLSKHFRQNTDLISRILGSDEEDIKAVDGVDLQIKRGESIGIAGESGCGKTTLARTAIRLLDATEGRIFFEGEDISDLSGSELNEFRREAQIIHQDPYKATNPRFRAGDWIREPLDIHKIGSKEERIDRVHEMLNEVGLRPPERYIDKYSTEMSGGELQRLNIGRAMILEPSLLVADEPVSMLDVSIKAGILDLFDRLQSKRDLTIIYVSHDLSMLRHACDRIGIMYLGNFVEIGSATEIVKNPKHPYTQALISSVPRISPSTERESVDLKGDIPDPVNKPAGCSFHPRCPKAIEGECDHGEIPRIDFDEKHWAKCVLYDEKNSGNP